MSGPRRVQVVLATQFGCQVDNFNPNLPTRGRLAALAALDRDGPDICAGTSYEL